MGSLHKGHIFLIEQARKNNDIVVLSIFVNPLQFLENEDFNKYPTNYEKDIAISKNSGVDIIFMPNALDIFNRDEISLIAPKRLGSILEGFLRNKHFDGVLQIVIKLFNLIISNRSNIVNSYFGQKDIQQLILIKQMVTDLYIPINIIEVETVRDKNQLAYSSRNNYLNNSDYNLAILIPKSFNLALEMIEKGEYNIDIIKNSIFNILSNIKIHYLEITDMNLNKIDIILLNRTLILISVEINGTKLIDNIMV